MKLIDLFSAGNQQQAETKATIEMQRVCQAITYGRLEERFNTANFTGEAKQFGVAINNMLDAISSPFNVATNYIERISKGEIPPKITENHNGDFNNLKNAINAVLDGLSLQTSAAQSISTGDLSIGINVRSENDVLSKSLIQIIEVQQNLQKELQLLTVASREGQLSERGKPEQFQGAYAEIVGGVNEMLDAIFCLLARVIAFWLKFLAVKLTN